MEKVQKLLKAMKIDADIALPEEPKPADKAPLEDLEPSDIALPEDPEPADKAPLEDPEPADIELPEDTETDEDAVNEAPRSSLFSLNDSKPYCSLQCCCKAHCALSLHVPRARVLINLDNIHQPSMEVDVETREEGWDYDQDYIDECLANETSVLDPADTLQIDSFMGILTSLNKDLAEKPFLK